MAGLLRLPLGPQTSEQDAADEVQVAHAKEHKEEEAHLASRLAVGRRRGGTSELYRASRPSREHSTQLREESSSVARNVQFNETRGSMEA